MPALPIVSAALLAFAATPPNIVLVVADDLGYSEAGCYGGTEIPTPNIDSLAASGVRMSAGYATCPMCAPTRAGLLTGKYQQRFGFEFNPVKGGDPSQGLPLDQTTLAERLQAAGYKTGLVGKWHQGEAEGMRPWERGFDSFYGFLGGGSPYLKEGIGVDVYDDRRPALAFDYLTDEFTRRSVEFIDRNANKPFFLMVSYNAVHKPFQAPPSYTAPFAASGLSVERTAFAGMLSALDQGVGQVREALERNALLDNTLFVFVGDNGGYKIDGLARTAPFRGCKGTVLEGGIRVPYIVSWPQRLAAGQTYDMPVTTMDLVPTAMAAAGQPVPGAEGLDGENILPYLNGWKAGSPHDALYWRLGDRKAIRRGDYKFVTWIRPRDLKVMKRLYNVVADPGETTDLRLAIPEKTIELRQALNAWSNKMAEPLWKPYTP